MKKVSQGERIAFWVSIVANWIWAYSDELGNLLRSLPEGGWLKVVVAWGTAIWALSMFVRTLWSQKPR